MSRISQTPLATQSVILCNDVTIDGLQITIAGAFISTPAGRQAPFRLFALIYGLPGKYDLSVEVVSENGEKWVTRKDGLHQHEKETQLSFFVADFTDASLSVGQYKYRVMCDGLAVGESLLLVV